MFYFSSASNKQEGSTLLVTLVLSAMILTLGASAVKIIGKELTFSQNLMFSQKAYFSAESGVETALFELQNNPVQHVVNHTENLGAGSSFKLDIENRRTDFEFDLASQENQKFRLLKDDNSTLTYTPSPVPPHFSLDATGLNMADNNFQWKILCQDAADKTIVSVGHESFSTVVGNFSGSIFNSPPGAVAETCFFSVENLSPHDLNFKFFGLSMTPEKATIKSIGSIGNFQKIIQFEALQKNLGGLFDFVFFHTDLGF